MRELVIIPVDAIAAFDLLRLSEMVVLPFTFNE
jgi:hypothetical protein